MVRIKFGSNGKPVGQDGVEVENSLKRARPADLNETSAAKKQKVEKNTATQDPETFAELDMPKELLDAVLAEFGFEKLTEIQKKAIPPALANAETDVIAQAKTGSGKTIAFLIPSIVHLMNMKQKTKNIGVGALILAPTRELAIQIEGVAKKILESKTMKQFGLRACIIVGGASKVAEQEALKTCNLMIATPGRCLDHLTNTDFNYSNLKYFILDEADQLIDSGFDQTIRMIVIKLPQDKMTYLFSATMTDKVENLAMLSMRSEVIRVGLQDSTTVSTLDQKFVQVPADKKYAALMQILKDNTDKKIICFLAIKKSVDYISYLLSTLGIQNTPLHGDMSQQDRTQTFQMFMNSKEPGIMICTDVAARGLDFPNVDLIIQCDLPEQFSNYFHRIGRTARAGRNGTALLMLTALEVKITMLKIKMFLKAAKQGGNDTLEVNEDELIQEYKLNTTNLNTYQKQICDAVYNDEYMFYEAPKIVKTYAGVFDMFARKMGFGRNDFDDKGLKSSFGMRAGKY